MPPDPSVEAIFAVLQFFAFGILVGRARDRYGVKAPSVSGNEHFERAFRVHANTLERWKPRRPHLTVNAEPRLLCIGWRNMER